MALVSMRSTAVAEDVDERLFLLLIFEGRVETGAVVEK
jgi:hypothetical protein